MPQLTISGLPHDAPSQPVSPNRRKYHLPPSPPSRSYLLIRYPCKDSPHAVKPGKEPIIPSVFRLGAGICLFRNVAKTTQKYHGDQDRVLCQASIIIEEIAPLGQFIWRLIEDEVIRPFHFCDSNSRNGYRTAKRESSGGYHCACGRELE